VKHLLPEQVEKLIAAANGDRNKLLFRMLFDHGLRISEALALTKASVQRGGYLRVKARKGGRHTDEKMNAQTLALWNRVTEHICPGTLVFPISRQRAHDIFHAACDKAGIELQPRQGVHSLRHSLGHALLNQGAPLPVVQKALRHRSIGSTGVYLEADGRDVDSWRAKATAATAASAASMSLAEVQREIARLSKLAASMQAATADTSPEASS